MNDWKSSLIYCLVQQTRPWSASCLMNTPEVKCLLSLMSCLLHPYSAQFKMQNVQKVGKFPKNEKEQSNLECRTALWLHKSVFSRLFKQENKTRTQTPNYSVRRRVAALRAWRTKFGAGTAGKIQQISLSVLWAKTTRSCPPGLHNGEK